MEQGKQAMENMKKIKMPQGSGPASALVKFLAFTGAAGYGIYHSIYNVPAGHRAVVYSRIDGVGKAVSEQGTHFVIPWLQRPIIFDVRTRPRTYASLTGTKDLQMINISIRVLSKPDRSRLQWIYTHLGLGMKPYTEPVIGFFVRMLIILLCLLLQTTMRRCCLRLSMKLLSRSWLSIRLLS